MDNAIRNFEKRHRALTAKHRKLAQGYVTQLNRNGTLEHRPIRRTPGFTLKGVLLAVAGFLVFKAYLLASMGPETYAGHLAQLSSGTVAERAGAWVMGVDPATAWVAKLMQGYLG
ncbi:hypothetical protein [Salipiger mucosus]|uniref:Uncharacterized protein n=1 Tax=Salipiger mucosus DSM 16094 TaxID=1123237 RepID=S9Q332_9RHOB|nr:hypothetical protein [Salipiger mucosus]EPX75731.1 hypothetical protein Salmuc_05369 [Salipiger mucosus DSM 16094]